MPEYNDKQNKNTRSEFLVAVLYLLEKCDSPEHASNGQDFVAYAQEKFDLYVDRRRAKPIFTHLLEPLTSCPATRTSTKKAIFAT